MKIKSCILLSFLAFPALLAACSIIPVDSPAAAPTNVPSPVPVTVAAAAATPTRESTSSLLLPTRAVEAIAALPSPEGALVVTEEVDGQPAAEACDQVAPGQPIDLTVQDGSQYRPGQGFSKTWRLVNTGACPWTRDYAVVWFSGQQLGVQGEQNLSQEIGPGESVDLTVDMVAPDAPGVYQSNWKLKNRDGELFGLGPNGNAPFWVQIEVVAESTTTPEQMVSPIPTLPVYMAKVSRLVYNDTLDLDSGELNLEAENDVIYRLGAGGVAEIMPQNNARIGLYGGQAPAEGDCEVADLDSLALPLDRAAEGIYLCYRTNRALPGYMHVQQATPEEGLISVDFVTWTVP